MFSPNDGRPVFSAHLYIIIIICLRTQIEIVFRTETRAAAAAVIERR